MTDQTPTCPTCGIDLRYPTGLHVVDCPDTQTAAAWTLRDIDNRGPDDDPYEITAPPAELAQYIDGPVRGDLTDKADHRELDALVAAFVAGDLTVAQGIGKRFAIYVTPSKPEGTQK